MIKTIRNATRGTNDCEFRIRSHVLYAETSYLLECRPPYWPVFIPARDAFGFNSMTRPKSRFLDYEEAEFVREHIIESGYSWSPENQCYLLHVHKKEPEPWKSPSKLHLKMQLSSAGAIAFSPL